MRGSKGHIIAEKASELLCARQVMFAPYKPGVWKADMISKSGQMTYNTPTFCNEQVVLDWLDLHFDREELRELLDR